MPLTALYSPHDSNLSVSVDTTKQENVELLTTHHAVRREMPDSSPINAAVISVEPSARGDFHLQLKDWQSAEVVINNFQGNRFLLNDHIVQLPMQPVDPRLNKNRLIIIRSYRQDAQAPQWTVMFDKLSANKETLIRHTFNVSDDTFDNNLPSSSFDIQSVPETDEKTADKEPLNKPLQLQLDSCKPINGLKETMVTGCYMRYRLLDGDDKVDSTAEALPLLSLLASEIHLSLGKAMPAYLRLAQAIGRSIDALKQRQSLNGHSDPDTQVALEALFQQGDALKFKVDEIMRDAAETISLQDLLVFSCAIDNLHGNANKHEEVEALINQLYPDQAYQEKPELLMNALHLSSLGELEYSCEDMYLSDKSTEAIERRRCLSFDALACAYQILQQYPATQYANYTEVLIQNDDLAVELALLRVLADLDAPSYWRVDIAYWKKRLIELTHIGYQKPGQPQPVYVLVTLVRAAENYRLDVQSTVLVDMIERYIRCKNKQSAINWEKAIEKLNEEDINGDDGRPISCGIDGLKAYLSLCVREVSLLDDVLDDLDGEVEDPAVIEAKYSLTFTGAGAPQRRFDRFTRLMQAAKSLGRRVPI